MEADYAHVPDPWTSPFPYIRVQAHDFPCVYTAGMSRRSNAEHLLTSL